MNTLHPKAAHWVRTGIYSALTSFADFEAKVNKIPEEKDRGDAFEIFIEGYLATQPITQCVRHWVVGDIPLPLRERYKLPRDATGIDGIFEVHGGSHVAYQVKYRQKTQLTFAEVAPFLGLTAKFPDRVIFTNASKLSYKAIQRTRWISREAFLDLSPNAFQSIEAWLKGKRTPVIRAMPDLRYQVEALADIKTALSKHDRSTVVMACGTGKTLIALWAAEQQSPQTVLVLEPSLTLLKQTLRAWSEQTIWGSKFSYLCVCSDETVGLRDDTWDTDKSEVGFRVDTDPRIVREFLKRDSDDVKVIFSTYQSSPIVGEGAKGLPPLDLAILDEAHKTTGHSGTAFTFALSDQNLPIRKRLFLTATPRNIDIRHRDIEGEFRVSSMEDEAVYGPRGYTLTFAVAAKKGIICPYKVVISFIDKATVDDFARKHGVTIVNKHEIETRRTANLIALKQAVDRVKATKIISFHSRVQLAKEFATSEPRGIGFYLDDFDVRHVNGKQTSAERGEIIRSFSAKPLGLLTNARCLTEGVDIPAVDMVAFIDPRKSRIDIAQAVGRAMRKPRGQTSKTIGYVVVPVFAGMGKKNSIEDAIKSEQFDVVADVLNALQEHDEDLVDVIREIKERKGAGEPFEPRQLGEKLELIGPLIDFERLTESIGIEVADRIGNNWDLRYGELRAYRERYGNCDVPMQWPDNPRLPKWISMQRIIWKRGKLNGERIERLDRIGFIWDEPEAFWKAMFAALVKYKSAYGNCAVPYDWPQNPKLSRWVGTQRQERRKDRLAPERFRRLDAIRFDWDPIDNAWEDNFAALLAFHEEHNHVNVPAGWVKKLGLPRWISKQREDKRSGRLLAERAERLETLGFRWVPMAESWNAWYSELIKFRKARGHCDVRERDNQKLAEWATELRKRKRSGRLRPKRIELLDKLDFVWDTREERWDEMFAALADYRKNHGDCNVPPVWKENPTLGRWVRSQRKAMKSGKLEKTYIAKLKEVGFVWDAFEAKWEAGCAKLMEYQKVHAHCNVPQKWTQDPGLGKWVSDQRKKWREDKLAQDKVRRLDMLGIVWNPKDQDD